MDSSNLTLYELAGADRAIRLSPHCWKVRMALAHKGLRAESVPCRFTDKDAIAFSGQQFLPVLVDDEKTISDSWRIAVHLEERFPERPSLFGVAAGAPLARFVNGWADGALLPALARIFVLDILECLDEADRDYFRASREKRFGQPLEQVVADRPGQLAALKRLLFPLRQTLAEHDFIHGEAPGYADYCVFGMFMWARCVSPASLVESDDPVSAWRERLLDAFDGLARSAPSFRR